MKVWVLFGVLALGALAFVVSLAWNDAIKSVVDRYYPGEKDREGKMKSQLIYAGIATFLLFGAVLMVVNYFPKVAKKSGKI